MKQGLPELFDKFTYEYEYVKRVSKETIRGYRNTFHILLKLMPDISLDTLTTHTIIDFFKILQVRKRVVGRGIIKTGVRVSTITSYWNKLNAFFHWLVVRGHLHENPLSSITRPTPVYADRKFLKKSDIEQIITAIHMHCRSSILIFKRNMLILYILLFCGLRREELMSLQVRDIDLDRKELTVRGEISKSKIGRQIPLHRSVLMHIKDYLHERRKYTTPQLLVSAQYDRPLTKNGLGHLIKRLREHSKIPFHLHQFRHTFAINFLRETNNLIKLKQLLGHKNISMTVLYLRCLPPEEMRGDIESMSIDNFI